MIKIQLQYIATIWTLERREGRAARDQHPRESETAPLTGSLSGHGFGKDPLFPAARG